MKILIFEDEPSTTDYLFELTKIIYEKAISKFDDVIRVESLQISVLNSFKKGDLEPFIDANKDADIVITGYDMDDVLTGFDAVKMLREVAYYDPKIIVYTGAAIDVELILDAFESGSVYSYVIKPDIDRVRTAIHRAIQETLRQYKTRSGQSNAKEVFSKIIEFPPQYYQAGVGILNYFGSVLREKHPDLNAKVKIVQEGMKLRLSIESEDGDPEIFEQALDEYTLVVTGKVLPEEYSSDPKFVMELKSELRIMQVRVETQRDLISYQEAALRESQQEKKLLTDKLFSFLELNLSKSQASSTVVSVSQNIENTVEIEQIVDISQTIEEIDKVLTELANDLYENSEVLDIQATLKAGRIDSPKKAQNSTALVRLRELIKGSQNTVQAVGKSVATVQKLAKLYNSIAQWCGLPQIPGPLLGK